MLRWSAEKLAAECGVGLRTIKRLEQVDGIPDARTSTVVAIKNAFEAAGIEFIGTPNDRPGIRIDRKS